MLPDLVNLRDSFDSNMPGTRRHEYSESCGRCKSVGSSFGLDVQVSRVSWEKL